MYNSLVELPTYDNLESEHILRPLLTGNTVAMTIQDPKMRVKKRAKKPVLLIAPIGVYGLDGVDLLFSLPGYGCEVATPGSIKSVELYRLGLTVKAAKILASELNELFEKQQTK